ncbi:ubiquitin-conjugating enzyme E2 T-like isoform X2 [Bacillus rossius redtenbacheri]|uniref:ubiquitin-conjugating enzyme E2 T-like isoform X2 n=1 Tax=Bacillus rossius redtenbacheri TaxID=93214 RepID=UPI002FDDBB6A
MIKSTRVKKELERITRHPPFGVSCWLKDESNLDILDACIRGLDGTPYESGIFRIQIQIPEKYPLEPPHMKFVTPVYHPNVDEAGRICMDMLKWPPDGTWSPVFTLSSVLQSIQVLLATPNPDDPLRANIAEEYRYNRAEYERKAREWTIKYAVQKATNTTDCDTGKFSDAAAAPSTEKRKSLPSEDEDGLSAAKHLKTEADCDVLT